MNTQGYYCLVCHQNVRTELMKKWRINLFPTLGIESKLCGVLGQNSTDYTTAIQKNSKIEIIIIWTSIIEFWKQ